ncbi:hypothetical protein PBK173_000514200, partial [Plasmodium berghei]
TNRNIKLKKEQFLETNAKWNESKINQSNKLHKKNDEAKYRSIGRILAETQHENLVLSTDKDKEREIEREKERKHEMEWERDRDRDRERERERERDRDRDRERERERERDRSRNENKPNDSEEKLLLIIKEHNGDSKSENPERGSGITVIEFSRTPQKKKKRSCTILAEKESENNSENNSQDVKQ